jgi:hypothetical protein
MISAPNLFQFDDNLRPVIEDIYRHLNNLISTTDDIKKQNEKAKDNQNDQKS